MMKYIKTLSLFYFLLCIQMYGSVNPELTFVLAYQTINNFGDTIASDNDDIQAIQLLEIMNNSISFDATQQNRASEQVILDNNKLTFKQALETYLVSFGQCYTKAGYFYGSSIIISSKYNKDIPITPNEYAQLIATLQKASNQFGSSITIDIPLHNVAPAHLNDLVNYILNMPPSSPTSYASYAAYGLAGVAATAATIGTAAIAYNLYQGKNWNDTEDAAGAYNTGITGAYNAFNNIYTAGMNAAGYQTGAQQETARQNTIAGINAARDAGARQIASEQAEQTQQVNQHEQKSDQDQEKYYDNLFNDIDATIDQQGGIHLTKEEIHALAPYAAGVLGGAALGAGAAAGAGAIMSVGTIAGEGAAAGISAYGATGAIAEAAGATAIRSGLASVATGGAAAGETLSPTWAANLEYLQPATGSARVATGGAAAAGETGGGAAVSPSWAANFEYLAPTA